VPEFELEVLIFTKLCEQNAIFMLYILCLMTLLQLESTHNPFQLSSIQTMQNHLYHTECFTFVRCE